MFDKLKAMGQVAALLKDKERLKASTDQVKAKLAVLRVEGNSGAGAVRAVASGLMRIESITLQPALVAGMAADDRTRELAGSLITEAVNDALSRAQAQMQEIVSKEAKALGLPDFGGDLGSLMP